MPIGVTAAGEMVFPLLCKDFLEQFRGKPAVEPGSVSVDKKPDDVEQKAAATKPEDVAPPEKNAEPAKSKAVAVVSKARENKARARRNRIRWSDELSYIRRSVRNLSY
jgi:hypothetical protein